MIRVTFVVVVVLLRVFQAAAQERGYLAIDDQGGRHAFSFRGEADAVNMCGTTACEVVASFASCLGVAYSSPTQGQDVWTWMEAATEADARVGALSECQAAGGPACEVLNVYCIDAPAVEAALELDQSTRRRVQQGLGSAGFDAGMADGLFGPRTRQAIRQWQSSRGAWASGYLTGAQVEALRGAGGLPPQMPAAAPAAAPAASAELESLFWQSVMNSTNPADFEAYLQQFPNGVFRTLAQNRQAALRAAAGGSSSAPAGSRVGGTRIPTSGSRVSGASVPASGSRVSGTSRPAVGAPPGTDGRRKPWTGGGWVQPRSDVRRQAGRRGVLDGECPAARVLRLESESRDGRKRDLDGRMCGWLGPGNGNAHVDLGWKSADGCRTCPGRPKDRQLGPPLRGQVRPGRPLCLRRAERQLGLPLGVRGRPGFPICRRRSRVEHPAALGGVRFRGGTSPRRPSLGTGCSSGATCAYVRTTN